MFRHILIVDDDSTLRLGLKRLLDHPNYKITTTYGFKDTRELDSNLKWDLAIVDLNLNDGKGTELISELKSKNPNMQSILIG